MAELPVAARQSTSEVNPSVSALPSELVVAFDSIYQHIHRLTSQPSTNDSDSNVAHSHSVDCNEPSVVISTPPLTASSLHEAFSHLHSHYHAALTKSRLKVAQQTARYQQAEKELTQMQQFLNNSLLPGVSQRLVHLRSTLMDPTVADIVQDSTTRLEESERRMHEATEKHLADGFHADSVVGRKLLSRARRLQEENESFEAALQTSEASLAQQSRLHALDMEIATERKINSELQVTLNETIDFLNEIESENEKTTDRNRVFAKQLGSTSIDPAHHVDRTANESTAMSQQQPSEMQP